MIQAMITIVDFTAVPRANFLLHATAQLATRKDASGVPPILAGNITPDVRKRVEQFYFFRSQLLLGLGLTPAVAAHAARLAKTQRCKHAAAGLLSFPSSTV